MRGFYGYLPDFNRRHILRFGLPPRLSVPDIIERRPDVPPYPAQGETNSCTGHCGSHYLQDLRKQQGLPDLVLSPYFAYYNGRDRRGWADVDNGAMITDVVEAASEIGVCREDLWPHDETKINDRPSQDAYDDAPNDEAMILEQLDNEAGSMIDKVCAVLAQGQMVIIGMTVYASFESDDVAKSGLVPNPEPDEMVMGGHAVNVVGYNRPKRLACCSNWWGDWGDTTYGKDKGSFWLPFDYFDRGDVTDCYRIGRVASVQKSNNPPLPPE